MTAPRPSYHLNRYYDHEFDGWAERVSMADANGGEFYAVIECGPGGRELAARREKAVELLLAAMREGHAPGLRGVIVTPHTLATAKRAAPETYGPPPADEATA